jgi:hypothetical protein
MNGIQPKPDRRNVAAREQLLDQLRREFRSWPLLRLTPAQAQRLLGQRPDICERVLHTLVTDGTLRVDTSGQYVRCDADQLAGSAPDHRE